MTKKQERMIAMSKSRYPNEGDLDKQLAFIDGYKSAKYDNFGLGIFIGGLVVAVLMFISAIVASTVEPDTYPQANALLNSPEWRIDTVETWVHGQDTTRTYRFVRNN